MENIAAKCTSCAKHFSVLDPLHLKGKQTPLVLLCGHPVCENCLSSALLSNQKIECKKCALTSPGSLTQPSLKELTQQYPLHHHILGKFTEICSNKPVVEDVRGPGVRFHPGGAMFQKHKFPPNQRQYQPRKPFLPCSECHCEALWACQQCKASFCGQCFNKVHQFRANRMHVKTPLVPIEDVKTVQEAVTNPEPQVVEAVCDEHPTQKLDFFCQDCHACVCSYCIVPIGSMHRNHNVIQITKMNEECMPTLLVAIENGKRALTNILIAQKALETTVDVCNPVTSVDRDVSVYEVAQQVTDHFAWMHGILQQTELQIQNQLKETLLSEKEGKKAIKMQVASLVELGKGILKEAEEAVADMQKAGGFMKALTLIQGLTDLQDLPSQLIVNRAGNIKFTVRDSYAKELATHCSIDIPPPKKLELAKNGPVKDGWVAVAVLENVSLEEDVSRASSVISSNSGSHMSSIVESEVSSAPTSLASFPPAPVPVRGFIPARTQEVVKLCHMLNPSSFFVLRIPDDKFLKDLSQKLQKSAVKQRQPSASSIIEGQLCLVEYNADRNWYRGRVRAVRVLDDDTSEGLVEVVYVDYGNTDVVPMSRVRNLPHEFTTIPPLAIRCRLANITPRGPKGGWTDEAIKFFANNASDCHLMCTVYKVESGYHWVDIGEVPGDNKSVPLSITDALLFLELGQLANEAMEAPIVPTGRRRPHIPAASKVSADKPFHAMLSHVNDPHHFYCQVIDDFSKYINIISTELTALYSPSSKKKKESLMIYTPTVGMSCAAFYAIDAKWYRATVTELPGGRKVVVQYVDFGNTATIMYTHLRQLPEKFLGLQALAMQCSLADIAPPEDRWEKRAEKYMVKILSDKVVSCTMVDSTTNSILMYDIRPNMDVCINSLMVEVGLAVSTGSSSQLPVKVITSQVDSVDDDDLTLESAEEFETLESMTNELLGYTQKPAEALLGAIENSSPKKVEPKKAKKLKARESDQEVKPKSSELEKPEDEFRIEVKVKRIFTPDNFFVSLTANIPHIQNMIDEMQVFYQNSKPTIHSWQLGERCAVLLEADQKWYRAVCVNKDLEGSMMVILPDIAEQVYVSLEDMRILDDQFKRVRDGTIKCHLAGVLPAGGMSGCWPRLAVEHMNQFINDNKDNPICISKKGEIKSSLPVVLTVFSTVTPGALLPSITSWISLNDDLVEKGLAIPIRGAKEVPTTTSVDAMKEIEDSKLATTTWTDNIPLKTVGDTTVETLKQSDEELLDEEESDEDVQYRPLKNWLPVPPIEMVSFEAMPTYVDNEGFIYFHDLVYGEVNLKVIQSKLQEKFTGTEYNSTVQWYPGVPCIAQYFLDKQWYRALTVAPAPNGEWKVVFVDYGNEETCSLQEMRRSDFLSDYPIQCHRAFLENIAPLARDNKWTTEALDFLHSSVVERQCTFNLRNPIGSPEPLKVNVTRFDGVNIAVDMVSHMYARRVTMRPTPVGLPEDSPPAWKAETLVNTGAKKKQKPQARPLSSMMMTGKTVSMPKDSRKITGGDNLKITLQFSNQPDAAAPKRALKSWYDETVDPSDSSYVDKSDDESETSVPEPMHLSQHMPYPYALQQLPADVKQIPVMVRGVLTPTEVIVHLTWDGSSVLMAEIAALEDILAEEAASQPQLYMPVAGMPCVACFAIADYKWCRTVVTGVCGRQISVLAVDRGYSCVLPPDRVVQMKPEWSTLPALLLRCQLQLSFIGQSSSDTVAHLAQILVNKDLTAHIVKRHPLRVQLFELDDVTLPYQNLIDEGQLRIMADEN